MRNHSETFMLYTLGDASILIFSLHCCHHQALSKFQRWQKINFSVVANTGNTSSTNWPRWIAQVGCGGKKWTQLVNVNAFISLRHHNWMWWAATIYIYIFFFNLETIKLLKVSTVWKVYLRLVWKACSCSDKPPFSETQEHVCPQSNCWREIQLLD